jgi:hypothetical protein
MSYIKTFEKFETDSFDKSPIQPGDYVTSYRGNGQLIEFDGEFAKIRLLDSSNRTVKVPVFAVSKIDKPDLEDQPATVEELKALYADVQHYVKIVDEIDQDYGSVRPEKLVEFMEDILIDVIRLQQKDRNTYFLEEYDYILDGIANIANHTKQRDPSLASHIDKILDKFENLQSI